MGIVPGHTVCVNCQNVYAHIKKLNIVDTRDNRDGPGEHLLSR